MLQQCGISASSVKVHARRWTDLGRFLSSHMGFSDGWEALKEYDRCGSPLFCHVRHIRTDTLLYSIDGICACMGGKYPPQSALEIHTLASEHK